jgi:hypothetical protein
VRKNQSIHRRAAEIAEETFFKTLIFKCVILRVLGELRGSAVEFWHLFSSPPRRQRSLVLPSATRTHGA